jgi:hypothetical protein
MTLCTCAALRRVGFLFAMNNSSKKLITFKQSNYALNFDFLKVKIKQNLITKIHHLSTSWAYILRHIVVGFFKKLKTASSLLLVHETYYTYWDFNIYDR